MIDPFDGSPICDELLIMSARSHKSCVVTDLPLSLSNDIKHLGDGDFAAADLCDSDWLQATLAELEQLTADLRQLKEEENAIEQQLASLEFDLNDIRDDIIKMRMRLEQLL